MTWEYQGNPITKPLDKAEGFIYLIYFKDGTKYLGKKSFWARRRKAIKGSLRKKVEVTESDWRTYRGSSELSKEKAKKGLVEKLEILHFCDSKGCLQFMELSEMVHRRVLCDPSYLNGNILLKIYKCFEPMPIKGNG